MQDISIEINKAFQKCVTNQNKYLMLYGGAGSGKSVFAAQKKLVRIISKHKHRFLFIRKVAKTIRNSQFKLMKDIISDKFNDGKNSLLPFFDIKENEMNIVCRNGNEIISAGVDDVEKLKSITGITGIWIEEATELTQEEFNQIDLRLRGETDEYKQMILTFNPVYIGHWLNQIKLDHCTRMKTTYLDNSFIDPDYKLKLDALKFQDENYYNIYALGNWGSVRNAERVYHQFNRNLLFTYSNDLNYDDVIISFDFNVNPMCAVMLLYYNDKYYQVKEWKVNNSNTEEVAELVAEYLINCNIINSVILTGDASGRAKGTKGFMSDYEIIQKVFHKAGVKYILRIPPANPPVRDRVNYVNKMFQTEKFYINESCIHSLQDRELITWKKGAEGFHIDKSDPDLTHLSDAADYGLWNTKLLTESEEQSESRYVMGGSGRWLN